MQHIDFDKSLNKALAEIEIYKYQFSSNLREAINELWYLLIYDRTMDSKGNLLKETSDEEKYVMSFNYLKGICESFYSYVKSLCKLLLIINRKDWKKETKNREQQIIDKAIVIIKHKKKELKIKQTNNLIEDFTISRLLRNFFIHYDEDIIKKREFDYKPLEEEFNVSFTFIEKNLKNKKKSFKINRDFKQFNEIEKRLYYFEKILKKQLNNKCLSKSFHVNTKCSRKHLTAVQISEGEIL